ncbi:hypothetical protein BGW37DRAFT_516015 [Umbelopsis sp. PMI_123]|nr:hypothetical protein BGW37DRAFT_516015 [Umbelopsis sp. PMI_123]
MAAQPLQGKVSIVTGGSRGIGEGIVKELAKQGATVVINYAVSEDRANALVKQIVDAGGQAIAVQADIGELDGAKKIVDAAVKTFGKIDIIVNNAGVLCLEQVDQVDVKEIERLYNVNVRGPLLLGALEAMSRIWSVELGSKNVTSNCINPGPVTTDMALGLSKEILESFQQLLDQRAAIKRFAKPQEIANVAAFLAGPGSQFITGDVLNAHGGLIYT